MFIGAHGRHPLLKGFSNSHLLCDPILGNSREVFTFFSCCSCEPLKVNARESVAKDEVLPCDARARGQGAPPFWITRSRFDGLIGSSRREMQVAAGCKV